MRPWLCSRQRARPSRARSGATQLGAGLSLLAAVVVAGAWGPVRLSPPIAGPRLPSLALRGAAPVLRVDFLDVGQGDAALVTSPTGKRVLIDGGPPESGPRVAAWVDAHGGPQPLDLILLSHRHADHLGGLIAVVRDTGTRVFMDATFAHPTPLYAELMRELAERGVPIRNATRGRVVDLGGGARLTLLGPPEPVITGSRSDVNSNSVVVRLDFGATSVLFAGDAEAPTERSLLGSGADVHATVLKVAHHGSRYASSMAFLKAASPRVAIISCAARNSYGHPHQPTLNRLRKVGARVYRTDRDGTISVSSDGRVLTVTTAHPSSAEEVIP